MAEHGTTLPDGGDNFDTDAALLVSGKVKKGPDCTVALMLETHPDPTRAERIRGFIDDRTIPATKIAEFCAKQGADGVLYGGTRPAKSDAIRRHRKRGTGTGCGCPA